jgi:hypothetical protein
MFGGVALFAVIFFASGMPRIQEDILQVCFATPEITAAATRRLLTPLQKIPLVGHRFKHEIPASDNVSAL